MNKKKDQILFHSLRCLQDVMVTVWQQDTESSVDTKIHWEKTNVFI